MRSTSGGTCVPRYTWKSVVCARSTGVAEKSSIRAQAEILYSREKMWSAFLRVARECCEALDCGGLTPPFLRSAKGVQHARSVALQSCAAQRLTQLWRAT